MIRLGGNFTIMMMVKSNAEIAIHALLQDAATQFKLSLHIDAIQGELHHHRNANYIVRVYGADSVGIVAKVTNALATTDFNILELESDVIGTTENPLYLMIIQGYSAHSFEALEQVIKDNVESNIDVNISPIESLIA